MTTDTNMQPDDIVRRWPAECAIDFDDDYEGAAPEGAAIVILAAVAALAITVGLLASLLF
jgi:hypothetical protein